MTPARMAALHKAGFDGGQVWSEAEIDVLLAQPSVLAVTEGDQGFALLRILPPETEILTLVIDPACQGQGHGQALLKRCLQAAVARKAPEMFLEVRATNQAARALYASAGFAEIARRPGYYRLSDGSRDDALILRHSADAEKTSAG